MWSTNPWEIKGQTTTRGTPYPTLLDKCVGSLTSPTNHVTLKIQETRPTVYSPYPRRTLNAMFITSAELKSLVLKAMQRKNQQRLMEVKMTRVVEKYLLCLTADISTMWISPFSVTTAYVYSMSSDRFVLPSFVSLYLISIFFPGFWWTISRVVHLPWGSFAATRCWR